MPARLNKTPAWIKSLTEDLESLSNAALLRTLRPVEHDGRFVVVNGRRMLNLAGNDYLGLASHPRIIQRARQALGAGVAGAGASRLVTGHTALHAECEAAFAAFKHAESALLFPTGYMANLGVITSLARPDDIVFSDKANHASLIDAVRLSGARHRVYPHLGHDKLLRLLRDARAQDPNEQKRLIIVTDSVFSMDGDSADLHRLAQFADEFGAILVIDEAHGTGTLGDTGAGLCQALAVENKNHVVVSTASKALGSLGGIVTGPRPVIDTLINRARSFIYTTGVMPVIPAMILEALAVLAQEPHRRERLAEVSRHVRERVLAMDQFPGVYPAGPVTPIVPLIVGSAQAALDLAGHLAARGYYAPAIRPPTVPAGKSRVRLSLRCDLTDDDVAGLLQAIQDFVDR
jgi:8-amino-7-oxononanoate synthase